MAVFCFLTLFLDLDLDANDPILRFEKEVLIKKAAYLGPAMFADSDIVYSLQSRVIQVTKPKAREKIENNKADDSKEKSGGLSEDYSLSSSSDAKER